MVLFAEGFFLFTFFIWEAVEICIEMTAHKCIYKLMSVKNTEGFVNVFVYKSM